MPDENYCQQIQVSVKLLLNADLIPSIVSMQHFFNTRAVHPENSEKILEQTFQKKVNHFNNIKFSTYKLSILFSTFVQI